MRHRKLKNWIPVGLWGVGIFLIRPLSARAQSGLPTLTMENQEQKLTVFGGAAFTTVRRENVLLVGPGGTFGFQFALTRPVSLGLTISQALSPADHFVSFISTVGIESRISLFGNSVQLVRLVKVDDQTVLQEKEKSGAFSQLILGFQQSFLNAEERTFAFSGPGFGLAGSLFLTETLIGSLEARAAFLTNGVKSLSTYQACATLGANF